MADSRSTYSKMDTFRTHSDTLTVGQRGAERGGSLAGMAAAGWNHLGQRPSCQPRWSNLSVHLTCGCYLPASRTGVRFSCAYTVCTCPSTLYGLSALEDGHVFAPAGAVGIDVEHFSREGPVDEAQNAGLGGDAGHVDVFLTGTDAGLHNGMVAMGHGFDFEQPAFMTGVPVIAGEFGHGS